MQSENPASTHFPNEGFDQKQYENIRTWLDGVVIDDEHKALATDVFNALSGIRDAEPLSYNTGVCLPGQIRGETAINVRTLGPGFMGRAPPFPSTEFFANMVVVAILLLFAPGFTLLAAGVFITSRVAEKWAGHD
ncbi:hypothetical protein C8034_v012254 [Colletotrichum sidae]|uniref:Uncharacterized protein n=1 Tax=Colletotrichum sidae TaxID=1347389 RepID=A0A4R8TH92_9PEZI|nr:hypothetical protein C8034_v012254 [Colletotrichum sidae]